MTTTYTPPPKTRGPAAAAGTSAALAVLLAAAAAVEPFTAAREGHRNVGYHDISHPTDGRYDAVCNGHTLPYSAGVRFTDAQCSKFLTADEQKYARLIAKCLPDKPLPFGVAKAFDDTAYNLGGGAFCRSSMAKKTMAGDLAGACAAISLYVYSGKLPNGKPRDCRIKANNCAGIITARASERALCEKGLHP